MTCNRCFLTKRPCIIADFVRGGRCQTQCCKNNGLDNSSATTKDIDDPRWFGEFKRWTSRHPINGWALCCPRQMHAHGRGILNTHTHNSRPSQKLRSARDMGNYYNQTSAFQAPLYKSLLMRPPCLTFGRLKP